MADQDVARAVEEAPLESMGSMDIDDVYTLMDVQMRERPTPRDLYRRWERQQWSVHDLDFTKDAADWALIPPVIRDQLLWAFHAFFLGEAAVTDTLSPIVFAAPTDEDRQYLATQLADEARHAIFFERFFSEVLGIPGLAAARSSAREHEYIGSSERGYAKLFSVDLVAATDAVRIDPHSFEKWIDAVVLYHLMVEGMLALYGEREILQAARKFDVLPGFRAGLTAVTRDESRHVNYGVYALSRAIESGLADRIVADVVAWMDEVNDVLVRPDARIDLPPPEMLPPELRHSFLDAWSFPITQLRKRLHAAGIRGPVLDSLQRQWWTQTFRNVDEYEARFGVQHPVRSEDPSTIARLAS